MPYITVSCVSSLRETRSVGSSSRRRASPVASLSSSPLVFGAIAYASSGSGSSSGGTCTGASFGANVSPVCACASFATAPDVAGDDLRDGLVLLAAEREELADALVGALRGVVHGRVRAHRAAEHAEHRDVADERVRERLEHERGQRARGARVVRSVSLPSLAMTVTGAAVERRGELLDDEVQQAVDADRLGGRADDHRREARASRTRASRRSRCAPRAACPPRGTPRSARRRIRRRPRSASRGQGRRSRWISSGHSDSSAFGPVG